MFSVEEIKAIAESVGTATGAAVGSSMATAGPAGDPVSLIYIVQFVSVTNQVSGLPLSYGMMSDSFDWVNLKFNPPESMMRQACGGRKPCDESDPGFKGHAWTPDGDLTEGELGLKMKGIATFHMTGAEKNKFLLYYRYDADNVVKITNRTMNSQGKEIAKEYYYGRIARLQDDGNYVLRYSFDRFDRKGNIIDCSADQLPAGDEYEAAQDYDGSWPPPECQGRWSEVGGTWMRVDDGTVDDARPENPSVPEDNNGHSGEVSKFAHNYVAIVKPRDHVITWHSLKGRGR